MSTQKDLVPPLELCKLIPAGEFEDTAFVRIDNTKIIALRRSAKWNFANQPHVPAPTLQEILEKLPRTVKLDFLGDDFHIYNDVPNGYGVSDKNPATAALRLWLQLSDKSELSDKSDTEKGIENAE